MEQKREAVNTGEKCQLSVRRHIKQHVMALSHVGIPRLTKVFSQQQVLCHSITRFANFENTFQRVKPLAGLM